MGALLSYLTVNDTGIYTPINSREKFNAARMDSNARFSSESTTLDSASC